MNENHKSQICKYLNIKIYLHICDFIFERYQSACLQCEIFKPYIETAIDQALSSVKVLSNRYATSECSRSGLRALHGVLGFVQQLGSIDGGILYSFMKLLIKDNLFDLEQAHCWETNTLPLTPPLQHAKSLHKCPKGMPR